MVLCRNSIDVILIMNWDMEYIINVSDFAYLHPHRRKRFVLKDLSAANSDRSEPSKVKRSLLAQPFRRLAVSKISVSYSCHIQETEKL